jgi:hypothetical protein
MMQQVDRLVVGGKTRGEVLRDLIHVGLLSRHTFDPAFYQNMRGLRCQQCFMPEAHLAHLTPEEIQSFANFMKEQGIATRG